MANTVVANGKIREYLAAGKPIPPDWATDRDGRPTTDPAAGLAGFPLLIGAPKGDALSLLVDVLTGVWSGGEWGPRVTNMDDPGDAQHTCHLLMALEIGLLMEPAEFKARVDAYVREVRAIPAAPGAKRVRVPGERGFSLRVRALAEGVDVPPATQRDLQHWPQNWESPARGRRNGGIANERRFGAARLSE